MSTLEILLCHPTLKGQISDATLAANIEACEKEPHVLAAFEKLAPAYERMLTGDAQSAPDGTFFVLACTMGRVMWGNFIQWAPPKKVSVAKESGPPIWAVAFLREAARVQAVAFYDSVVRIFADLKAGKIASVDFPQDIDVNQSAEALVYIWLKARQNRESTYSPEGFPTYPGLSDDYKDAKEQTIQFGLMANSWRTLGKAARKAKAAKAAEKATEGAAPATTVEAPEEEAEDDDSSE